MRNTLGPLGILGILIMLGGIVLIASQNLLIAAGFALVLAGLGLVVKAIVSGMLQAWGMF